MHTLRITLLLAASLSLAHADRTRTTRGESDRTSGQATWRAEHRGDGRPADTVGQSQRTENGRRWSATTTATRRNGETVTAQTEGVATRTTDYEGNPVIQREWTRTCENGHVVTGRSETRVDKTENGRSWETNGTVSGPRGISEFTGSGSAVRTENGSTWQATRQGSGPEGRGWTEQAQGRSTRTETGRTFERTATRQRR